MKKGLLLVALCSMLAACAQAPETSEVAGTPIATLSPSKNTWSVTQLPTTSLVRWGSSEESKTDDLHKPIVINLWASWCSACVKEMPLIANSKYAANVVAINVGDLAVSPAGTQTANELVASTKDAFPIYIDMEDSLLKKLKVNGLPVTFAVNANNTIVDFEFGEVTNETLARLVQASKS